MLTPILQPTLSSVVLACGSRTGGRLAVKAAVFTTADTSPLPYGCSCKQTALFLKFRSVFGIHYRESPRNTRGHFSC